MVKIQSEQLPNKNNGFPIDKASITPGQVSLPAKAYTTNIGRGRAPTLRWEPPEWDLVETGRIIDTESYARRAHKVKKNLFLKEGYSFSGSDINRIRYIKKRFQQMEYATKYPFPMLMADTVASLIRTFNCFWIKVRKTSASGGKVRINPDGKKLQPVAGYFILPAETVRFKRDEFGKLVKYQQEVYGKVQQEFRPEDIIHFHLEKRPGFSVGTPDLVSIKDDIRALRRIEENVEMLLQQHLFPLFHYQVGTEDAPAAPLPDGTTEIGVVMANIASMPSDGCWVTPERHKITPLQGSAPPIPVEKVIEHFKQRIFTGFGVSSVDMGEGGTASRSTAQTMSRNLIDDTKASQKEFGSQFYAFVLQELLQESTFSDGTIFNEEFKVTLKFHEIDFEARQAKENHYMDLFLKNGITHTELRQELGREPFQGTGWPTSKNRSEMFTAAAGDWANTNYGLIERDKALIQAVDEPVTPVAQAESKSRAKQNTKSAGGGSVANKNQPANQHGKRASAKTNKDALDFIYKQQAPLSTIYKSIRADLVNNIRMNGVSVSNIILSVNMAFSEARDRLVNLAKQSYRAGLRETGRMIYEVQLDKIDAKIQDHVEKYTYKLRDQLIENIEKHTIKQKLLKLEDAIFVGLIFDALEHRTNMIDDSEIMRAYNYGLCSGYKLNGFEELTSVRNSDEPCSICDQGTLKYKSNNAIIYEELPPLHPHCTCIMRITK